jgi:hypothetical protein
MDQPARQNPPWVRSRSSTVLLAFLGIAGFFLVTEHTAHVFGVLRYAAVVTPPSAAVAFQ